MLEEREPLADLRQDIAGDERLAVATETQLLEMFRRVIDAEPREFAHRNALQMHGRSVGIQSRAFASGALDEFLVVSGVSSSNTLARTLIGAGAVTVDGEKITDAKWVFAADGAGPAEGHLVKAGKRQWRRARR